MSLLIFSPVWPGPCVVIDPFVVGQKYENTFIPNSGRLKLIYSINKEFFSCYNLFDKNCAILENGKLVLKGKYEDLPQSKTVKLPLSTGQHLSLNLEKRTDESTFRKYLCTYYIQNSEYIC